MLLSEGMWLAFSTLTYFIDNISRKNGNLEIHETPYVLTRQIFCSLGV
jgi:hypothetical protein